jgi:hypothetical protein
VSPEERVKFTFLAGLVHEGLVQPLTTWLSESPEWTERFVTELLDDGFVALAASPSLDPSGWLPSGAARALLSSADARAAYDVWLVPTPEGFPASLTRATSLRCSNTARHRPPTSGSRTRSAAPRLPNSGDIYERWRRRRPYPPE